MLNADDILMPHPPEVAAMYAQKRVASFDKQWPGVVLSIKKWMKDNHYSKLRRLVAASQILSRDAPIIVVNRMAAYASYHTGALEWEPDTQEDVTLVDVANILWRDYVKSR